MRCTIKVHTQSRESKKFSLVQKCNNNNKYMLNLKNKNTYKN